MEKFLNEKEREKKDMKMEKIKQSYPEDEKMSFDDSFSVRSAEST